MLKAAALTVVATPLSIFFIPVPKSLNTVKGGVQPLSITPKARRLRLPRTFPLASRPPILGLLALLAGGLSGIRVSRKAARRRRTAGTRPLAVGRRP